MDCYIRECLKIDIDAIVKLEKSLFEFNYTREEVEEIFNHVDYEIIVAEKKEQIVGYAIFKRIRQLDNFIQITCIGVAKEHQGQKIGKQLFNAIKKRLQIYNKYSIYAMIRETNLEAQLKFRSLGFKATKILHNYYEIGSKEPAYVMVHKVKNKILLHDL